MPDSETGWRRTRWLNRAFIAAGLLILVFHRSIDAWLGAPVSVASIGGGLAGAGAMFEWTLYRKRRRQPGKAELREIAERQPRTELWLCVLYWVIAALSLAAWLTLDWPYGELTVGLTIFAAVFVLLFLSQPLILRSLNILALSRSNPALRDERARENHVKGIEAGFAVGLQTALLLSLVDLLGFVALAGIEVGVLTAVAMMLTATTRTAWRNWKDAQ